MNRFRALFNTAIGHLTAIGVGLLIIFVSLSIMLGSLNNAVSLLVMSIVCTVGIGLAFWSAIAWMVGWTVLLVLAPLFSQLLPAIEPENTANEDRRGGEQTALRGYIQRSLAARATESQITRRLISQGWSETEIEQAYQAVRGQS